MNNYNQTYYQQTQYQTGYQAPPYGQQQQSVFLGGAMEQFGVSLLVGLWIFFTLGIGTAWAICYQQRWFTQNTVISGRRLIFVGKGGDLFGKLFLWGFLTFITCGLYGLITPNKMTKWITERTYLQ